MCLCELTLTQGQQTNHHLEDHPISIPLVAQTILSSNESEEEIHKLTRYKTFN